MTVKILTIDQAAHVLSAMHTLNNILAVGDFEMRSVQRQKVKVTMLYDGRIRIEQFAPFARDCVVETYHDQASFALAYGV